MLRILIGIGCRFIMCPGIPRAELRELIQILLGVLCEGLVAELAAEKHTLALVVRVSARIDFVSNHHRACRLPDFFFALRIRLGVLLITIADGNSYTDSH